jgi:Flp pilus assembly protein TadB
MFPGALPIIFVTIFSIGGPVAIIIVAIALHYWHKKKYYDSLVKALETGKKPEEIKELFEIESHKREKNGKGFLIGGTIVTGLGIAFLILGMVVGEVGLYGSSAFFIVMGLTLAVVYFFTRPRKKQE